MKIKEPQDFFIKLQQTKFDNFNLDNKKKI